MVDDARDVHVHEKGGTPLHKLAIGFDSNRRLDRGWLKVRGELQQHRRQRPRPRPDADVHALTHREQVDDFFIGIRIIARGLVSLDEIRIGCFQDVGL
jgi:hypothetical protein